MAIDRYHPRAYNKAMMSDCSLSKWNFSGFLKFEGGSCTGMVRTVLISNRRIQSPGE